MKMKKLSEEHYIIVDDSEIKEGDWIGFPNLKKFVPVQYFGGDLTGGEKKITHSTQPESLGTGWMQSVQPFFLSEVKELLGEVDVDNIVDELSEKPHYTHSSQQEWFKIGAYSGYNQALEDNKEKKYTEEEMRAVFMHGFLLGVDRGDYSKDMEDRALSNYTQPKTSWEVEFVDGKLKLKS